MSYRSEFPDNAYVVLLEHEIQGKNFTEIAKQQGYTNVNASRLYRRALRIKKDLYFKEILKKSNITPALLGDAYNKKRELYYDQCYVIAYLEITYGDILTPYRDGEPASPYIISNLLGDFDEPPITMHPYQTGFTSWEERYEYVKVKSRITFGGYLFCRFELSSIEQQVMCLKASGKSYANIGQELRITPEKAKRCYQIAQMILARVNEHNVTGRIESIY